jgi:hypothetical protein
MCEPSHSIVQYPTYDPFTEDPIRSLISTAVATARTIELSEANTPEKVEKIQSSLLLPQGVVSGNFINYSRFGSGHSESIGKLPTRTLERLPQDVKYEAHWWNRNVKLDSRVPKWVETFGKQESLDSATFYAERASIGDLKIFRRFLENSLKFSDRPYVYIDHFMMMLTSRGKTFIAEKLRWIFNGKAVNVSMTLHSMLLDKKQKEVAIGVMLKATRKREYLCAEWSDDPKLWVKGKGKGEVIMS